MNQSLSVPAVGDDQIAISDALERAYFINHFVEANPFLTAETVERVLEQAVVMAGSNRSRLLLRRIVERLLCIEPG